MVELDKTLDNADLEALRGGPQNLDRVLSWIQPIYVKEDHPTNKTKCKRYAAKFNAEVALETIKGERTLT
jgi:hypothetical protein